MLFDRVSTWVWCGRSLDLAVTGENIGVPTASVNEDKRRKKKLSFFFSFTRLNTNIDTSGEFAIDEVRRLNHVKVLQEEFVYI